MKGVGGLTINRGGARLVIVTGGGRGIGAAVARLAAAQGYAVAVNFVRDRSAAQRVVEEIALSGGSAIPIKGDVAQAPLTALRSGLHGRWLRKEFESMRSLPA
jgi:NAD(P)-dependent dehydrogenase (short-subunit alcohol dehydrogenase family)